MSVRPSQRPYNVEYYRLNRDLELQRVRVRQAGMVELLRELREVPCADCGGQFQPHQMDVDHRDPSTKSFKVMTGRAMLMATQKVLAEVAKCDIVCVNCHRIRTRDQETSRPRRAPSMAPSQVRRARVWKEQAELLNRARDVPCMHCGGRFDPCAMDFDHRDPVEKRYTVSRMVGRQTTAQTLDEIAKCDIVCANCHRLRTWAVRSLSGSNSVG